MMKNFQPVKNLSYDESIVRYFGHHGLKQYMKNKPSKFGYKVWSLNTTEINFEIYQGIATPTNEHYDQYFGKCTSPLLSMIDELPENVRNLSFSFFFDNLFTNLPVLSYLRERGYGGTGTIRANKIPKNDMFS